MKKEFCRYAIYDGLTGVRLICGEKYKIKRCLEYVESFRGLCTRFRKVSAYGRKAVIKGRNVDIVYWFNSPVRTPARFITEAGLILGVR